MRGQRKLDRRVRCPQSGQVPGSFSQMLAKRLLPSEPYCPKTNLKLWIFGEGNMLPNIGNPFQHETVCSSMQTPPWALFGVQYLVHPFWVRCGFLVCLFVFLKHSFVPWAMALSLGHKLQDPAFREMSTRIIQNYVKGQSVQRVDTARSYPFESLLEVAAVTPTSQPSHKD